MVPVIRVDNQVFEELKKRAIELGLVFETPNTTLRKVLGLDSEPDVQQDITTDIIPTGQNAARKEYLVFGRIYCQNIKRESSTWEIGHLTSPGRELLPYDEYPFVKEVGINVDLVIEGKEYPVSFHHYEGEKRGGYFGRRPGGAPSIKSILANHNLVNHHLNVELHFVGKKVYLKPLNQQKPAN
jgi:hypothetical protein